MEKWKKFMTWRLQLQICYVVVAMSACVCVWVSEWWRENPFKCFGYLIRFSSTTIDFKVMIVVIFLIVWFEFILPFSFYLFIILFCLQSWLSHLIHWIELVFPDFMIFPPNTFPPRIPALAFISKSMAIIWIFPSQVFHSFSS